MERGRTQRPSPCRPPCAHTQRARRPGLRGGSVLGGGCPGPPRVTPLAPSRVCAPLPVPRGPGDGGTSLSVCWAQLPRALAWQAGSAGLGGREPAWPRGPLGAGAAHWPRGDPHGAADTGRLVLWNETPLSASLRQLRPRSFISEKKNVVLLAAPLGFLGGRGFSPLELQKHFLWIKSRGIHRCVFHLENPL